MAQHPHPGDWRNPLNDDVEVKAGDKVMDADGTYRRSLAAGMMVINAAGETVEFTGDPVMMKQLDVNLHVPR